MVVINYKIVYILIINNRYYNIVILYYQRLGKAITFDIKEYYYILIKERYLANKLILIKKELDIIIIALLTTQIL